MPNNDNPDKKNHIETPDSEEKQENITREIESASADTDKQEVQAEDDELYFDDSFLFEDENTETEIDEEISPEEREAVASDLKDLLEELMRDGLGDEDLDEGNEDAPKNDPTESKTRESITSFDAIWDPKRQAYIIPKEEWDDWD